MIDYLTSPAFWVGFGQIVFVNILLSGDNAVVIALAARSLPPREQKLAIIWGSVAAVIALVGLTILAVEALKVPYLRLVGSILLLWIAVQLLVPEDDDEGDVESKTTLAAAIRVILIADLIMSLDNVLGVAAVAKGDIFLLCLGLGVSIPVVVFGSTIIMKLMNRFPFIVTLGAALLGSVAVEMFVGEPVLEHWIPENIPWIEAEIPYAGGISVGQILGALLVIAIGKVMAVRAGRAHAKPVDLAEGDSATKSSERR